MNLNYDLKLVNIQYEHLNKHLGKALQKNKIFYHYTTFQNLMNLLSDDLSELTFWVTNFLYCNDHQEFLNGFETLKYAIEELKEENCDKSFFIKLRELVNVKPDNKCVIDLGDYDIEDMKNRYVLCFCKHDNLLNQWKTYGKSSGVSIGFNLDNVKYYILNKRNEKSIKHPDTFPYEITYDESQKNAVCKKIIGYYHKVYNQSSINNINSDISKDLYYYILLHLAFFKHESFLDEHEARLLFSPCYNEGIKLDEYQRCEKVRQIINHREKGEKIVPI